MGTRRFFHFYFVGIPGTLEREVGRHEFRSYAGQHTDGLIAEAHRRGRASMAVGGVRLRVSALREAGIEISTDGDR